MPDCFSPIDRLIDTNPKCGRCLCYTFIVILFAFLIAGLYLFLPEQKSITGAALLLIGAIGLMFLLVLYALDCMIRPTLLPR
jgi:hypothetical protein